MLKTPESNEKKQASDGDDAMALILQQAGKSADEVAALSTLDDADRSAESQFSGEAPTITSLFGKGRQSDGRLPRVSDEAQEREDALRL